MQRVREQVQVPEQLHSGAGRVKSVTVAVLDTGIAYHPDLVGRLLAFSDFVEGRSFPYDDNGHGTHVCGIVCEMCIRDRTSCGLLQCDRSGMPWLFRNL